jgi:hypothetical protein
MATEADIGPWARPMGVNVGELHAIADVAVQLALAKTAAPDSDSPRDVALWRAAMQLLLVLAMDRGEVPPEDEVRRLERDKAGLLLDNDTLRRVNDTLRKLVRGAADLAETIPGAERAIADEKARAITSLLRGIGSGVPSEPAEGPRAAPAAAPVVDQLCAGCDAFGACPSSSDPCRSACRKYSPAAKEAPHDA